jgi:hypothetical protein
MDYLQVTALSIEARQKLPETPAGNAWRAGITRIVGHHKDRPESYRLIP